MALLRQGANLLHQSHHVGLPVFPDDLSIGQVVDVEGLNRDRPARGRYSHECVVALWTGPRDAVAPQRVHFSDL